MKNTISAVAVAFACLAIVGCGSGGGKDVKLIKAGGKVKYNGAPLAGAVVTFLPDKGPVAMATTDMNGEFNLNSGAMAGCAIGPAKAAVRVVVPDDGKSGDTSSLNPSEAKTPQQMQEMSAKMASMTKDHQEKQKAKPKGPLIPERYKDPDKSNLKYTIEADASKNVFDIDLRD